jgi:hypothetical protein
LIQSVLFTLRSLNIVVIGRAVAAKAGPGKSIDISGVGFITGNLLSEKPGVGLVRVQALNDIVPVAPGIRTVQVVMKSRTVSVAGKVKPVSSPAFAMSGTGKKLVEGPLVGVRSFIGKEFAGLSRGRWQADDVQVGATEQPGASYLWRWD